MMIREGSDGEKILWQHIVKTMSVIILLKKSLEKQSEKMSYRRNTAGIEKINAHGDSKRDEKDSLMKMSIKEIPYKEKIIK